jgi:hypothetical protein
MWRGEALTTVLKATPKHPTLPVKQYFLQSITLLLTTGNERTLTAMEAL